MVRYVWRTYAIPEVDPSDEEEEAEGKRPAYRLTAKQIIWLQKMQRVAPRDEEDEWADAFDV